MQQIDVAAVHFTPAFGDVEANRAAVVVLCAEAAKRARVVVLPELCTTGFCLTRAQAEEWAEGCAEDGDSPTVTALAPVAAKHDAVIVVGLALRGPDGTLRNGQVVIDADGRPAGRYFKRHLYEADFAWATAGPAPGAIVSTRAGAIGLLICHDLVHPETVLALAARRPRLLAFSTAWMGDEEPLPNSWSAVAQLLDPAPLVVANRGGAEGAVRFSDPSAILVHGRPPIVGTTGSASQILYGSAP